MVNRVLLLLKMEVSELMRAAMNTAIIRPRRPGERWGRQGRAVKAGSDERHGGCLPAQRSQESGRGRGEEGIG